MLALTTHLNLSHQLKQIDQPENMDYTKQESKKNIQKRRKLTESDQELKETQLQQNNPYLLPITNVRLVLHHLIMLLHY